MSEKTILVIGTYDTKNDELEFISDCIAGLGETSMAMDVGVLGNVPKKVDITREEVSAAGGMSIGEIIAIGDENEAMQIMAKGAATLASHLHEEGKIHGVIVLGGSMGTDLALDVCASLPLGVPKHIVSTVAFSPMIPPFRLAPDIQMTLWAGGLYGLNSICKSSLSQAAGAVVGAVKVVCKWDDSRPVVGMTSFGSTVLSYMIKLKPEIEKRGFEVAVFHATGMGGMAFDTMAGKGKFACVMDFAPQEMSNLLSGSVLNAGPDRLYGAGRSGTPQLIAPGCIDLVDFPTWQEKPEHFRDREFHDHNRLICSAALTVQERCAVAREICSRISKTLAPVHVLLPTRGIQGWDQEGQPFHDPEGLSALLDTFRSEISLPVSLSEVDAHINDDAFSELALHIFDGWLADGTVQV